MTNKWPKFQDIPSRVEVVEINIDTKLLDRKLPNCICTSLHQCSVALDIFGHLTCSEYAEYCFYLMAKFALSPPPLYHLPPPPPLSPSSLLCIVMMPGTRLTRSLISLTGTYMRDLVKQSYHPIPFPITWIYNMNN